MHSTIAVNTRDLSTLHRILEVEIARRERQVQLTITSRYGNTPTSRARIAKVRADIAAMRALSDTIALAICGRTK